MFLSKAFIALLILLLPLVNNISTEEKSKSTSNSNIEKLTANFSGRDEELLDKLSFEIRNSTRPFSEEINNIPPLLTGYKKTYLYSLILKKTDDYGAMFDSLFSLIEQEPDYYPFYNELVFAAAASDRLNLIEEFLSKHDSTGYNLYLRGLLEASKGYNQKAGDYLLTVYEKDSTNKNVLYQLALIYRSLGNYKESADYLRTGLKLYEKDTVFTTAANLALGALYFLSGELSLSDKYYSAALKTALKTGDRYSEAKAKINIGINEDVKGNVEEAKNYFHKASQIAGEISDAELKALALSELGVSYTYTYDLINAKKNYVNSYELYRKTGNRVRLSLLSENLGKIYSQMYDYPGAIKYFKEGIGYAGENKRALYLNLTGLASVYNNLSDYSKALKLYREAGKISDEIDDASLKGETNVNLGLLNYNLGRYSNALEFYTKADNYFKMGEYSSYSAETSHKIALAYLYSDSLELAERYFQTALRGAAAINDPYLEAQTLIDFAELRDQQEDSKEAFSLLKKAEAISRKNSFDNLLAELYMAEGKLLAKTDNFFNARNKFNKADEISRGTGNYTLVVEALYRLALLYQDANLPEAAESYYKSAVAEAENKARPLFEDQEVQIAFFNLSSQLYNSYADFCFSRQMYKEGFEILDKGHSRNTVQNLNNIKLRSLIADDGILEQIHEYDWILNSGAYDSAAVDSVKVEFNKLKTSLQKRVPEIESYFTGGKYYTLDEIRKNLSAGENIIVIHPSENNTTLLRLSKKDFEVKTENISAKELRKMIDDISPYYSGSSAGSFYNQDLFAFDASASNRLYSKLLKNILAKVPDNSSIIFIPPSEMLLLPFEFLVTEMGEEESAYNYTNKSFLVNKYNISYSPSVSVYAIQKNSQLRNEDKYLLVGNPYIDETAEGVSDRRSLLNGAGRNSILPLKYSAEEISEIGSILKTNRILTEKNATESNFRNNAENSRIIHISTHSFLMNNQPVIFLSNSYDPSNDGFLEASEIMQMKLNTDLVVLSSCNSGTGRIEEAEGIVGMTKAFFEAGTRSVIVSLWEVNDKYTSSLMKFFYSHLSSGMSKPEALRRAKLDFIREESPNPYYWSAFVLAGNPAGINLNRGTEISSFILPGLILLASVSLFLFYLRKRHLRISNPS